MDENGLSGVEVAIAKLETGRLRSGRDELLKALHDCRDPVTKVIVAYNLGGVYWASIGDGENARKFYQLAIEDGESIGIAKVEEAFPSTIANAYENMMHLSFAYEEYFSWTAKLRRLQPEDDVLRGMVPDIREAQEKGVPWSDTLEKIARLCYDRSDPSRDRGEYARAVSTYQLILLNRKAMRLSREAWRRVTYEYGALALRVAADAMNTMMRSQQPPDTAEFVFVVRDAKVHVDEYYSANPADEDVQVLVRNMDGFLSASGNAEIDSLVARLNDEGLDLLNREEFQAAASKFAEAEKICRDGGDQEKLQTCIGNMALVAEHEGDPDRALELIEEKEAICRKMGLHTSLANALGTKAEIFASLHRTEEGIAAAKEAGEICKEHGLDELARELRPLVETLETQARTPGCYVCAEEGHRREMAVVEFGTLINRAGWNKPWAITQGCFQCAQCGRLTCYTHSEMSRVCACGASTWIEKSYLQQEYDNG